MSFRADALHLYQTALAAVQPEGLIQASCHLEGDQLWIQGVCYDLNRYRKVLLFGSGKAAWTMAQALLTLLGERIDSGVVVVPEGFGTLDGVEVVIGSHPVPDERSVTAATTLQQAMHACDPDDLVIYLLSGGSSALIEIPIAPVTLQEFQNTTRMMLRNDLEIHHMNVVRKHLSSIKGGRLGALCPATCAVLVVSDVLGDDFEVIGSAPMYGDESTFADAKALLEAKALWHEVPSSVRGVLEKGCRGEILESPRRPNARVHHYLIGHNAMALEAMATAGKALGYETVETPESLHGDADDMARTLVDFARNIPLTDHPQCYLFGGETTVVVRGDGRGGRNQQLCLRALALMDATDAFTLLSAGSDGIDGNSDAAGACIDPVSRQKADAAGCDLLAYLADNDAATLFQTIGDAIVTGPSGTNVMDVAILITPARS